MNFRLQELEEECRRKLVSEGFPASSVRVETFLHLRYKGTDCALMCPPAAAASGAQDVAVTGESSSSEEKSHVSAEDEQDIDEGNGIEGYGRFMKYYREFGFVLKGRAILVDDVRVRGVAASGIQCRQTVASAASPPQPLQVSPVYLEEGMYQTPVYRLEDLRAGHLLPGPAVVLDNLSTILIEPGACLACNDTQHDTHRAWCVPGL
ncbi:hypothetical protein HAZT_HAZT004714 [Hyalella azteca]|uniref:Acetophenone carboxylase-like C-terminal domain-containing protein n=1 Tax=Hyalella azteca TaxID=294128 RepID=A0A6A0H0M9_HYAAZ|nr:hypothetical protein HAZT_HAZT004714 [Hyalella azteca]